MTLAVPAPIKFPAQPVSQEIAKVSMLTLNVPDWFKDDEFIAAIEKPGIMTWHIPGQPPVGYSDVVLWVDPGLSGDGAEAGELPWKYWDIVVDCARQYADCIDSRGAHLLVRLTNTEA